MSNQNNSMQKMEISPSVNLARYKKNIEGEIKVNETNMAVIGHKFTPVTREDSYIETDNLMEVGSNLYGYNDVLDGDYFNIKDGECPPIDVNPQANKVAILKNGYITFTDNSYKFVSTSPSICPNYTFSSYELGEVLTDEFYVFELRKDNSYFEEAYLLCNGTHIVWFNHMGSSESIDWVTYHDNNVKGRVLSVLKLYNGENYGLCFIYQDENGNYKVMGIEKYADGTYDIYYTYYDLGKKFLLFTLNTDKDLASDEPTARYFLLNEDLEMIYYYNNGSFSEITPTSTMDEYPLYTRLLNGLDETGNSIIDCNIQRNGGLFTVSAKIGKSGKFRLVNANPFMYNHSKNYTLNEFVTLENNIPTDNYIFRNGGLSGVISNYILQGCNIVQGFGCGYDTIDQNFMYLKCNSKVGGYVTRVKNGDWHKFDVNGTPFKPIAVGNKIYYSEAIVTIYENKDTSIEYRNSTGNVRETNYRYFDPTFTKVYESNDDWYSQAKYVALGNNIRLTVDNYEIMQIAPFLMNFNLDEELEYFTLNKESNIYVQKAVDDANLYNYKGEIYTVPTDSDFFIPIMPTDKIVSQNQNGILIERIDGSKAQLIRYNNQYYPLYYYSSINYNTEYVFICQGQIYNVSGGVIYDANGVGIIDVSDQKFLGCNGVIALFYNDRNKTIYQFSAANDLSVLFDSDDIKEIKKIDVSHTNDEIYIGFVNYDDEYRLICIDNDGTSYVVDVNDGDFFVGKKGIYIKGDTWILHRFLNADDTEATKNNYIETNYFGTDEFKLVNIDRVYLRFIETCKNGVNNKAVITLSMLTLDGKEIDEQYTIELSDSIHRIAPKQKNCIGIKVRIDGLTNYTLTALSVGVTDDSNIVIDNKVKNNNLDASIFE